MATPTTPAQQPQSGGVTPMEVATVALVALYLAANVALLDGLTKIVRQVADPRVLYRKSVRLAAGISGDLERRTGPLVAQIISHARTEATDAAHAAFHRAGGTLPPTADDLPLTHAQMSVKLIQDDLEGRLAETQQHILRAPDDLYRRIVAEQAKTLVGDTGTTPLQAQAAAFAQFVEAGITGYTTRDNRRLTIESYTEMAVRTAGMHAFNEEYQGRLASIGVSYFTVPDDGHPCPLCWPWQGRILTTGLPDEVASATVDEATAAGLFHPQCRHVLTPYFPGHNPKPKPSPAWSDEQAARYAATQRLRALERRVRAQKDVRDHAATPEVKQAAAKRVRATQAAIRAHVEQHDLVRRSHREQPRLGFAPHST